MSFQSSVKKPSAKIAYCFKRFFPIPKYLSFDPVAIDVAPGAIRILKLEERPEGLIPVLHKEVIFDDKCDLTDEDIREDEIESVVKVLKKLKLEYKLKYVITSLPEQKTYIYRTRFPREALSDMADAIRFSMEENVPLPVDEVNFEYNVIKVDDDDAEVVVSVFPKSVVKIYTDILKKAKLFPVSFQSESSSIARSVVRDGNRKPYLLIRMLKNEINVAIIENDVVQYTSRISVPGEKVAESLLNPETKTFSQELNRTLIYWFTSKKDIVEQHKIQDAILVGKYAQTEGLVEYLENALKIDVTLGNVWKNCFSADEFIPEIPREESLDYSVTVGLAIKALKYK